MNYKGIGLLKTYSSITLFFPLSLPQWQNCPSVFTIHFSKAVILSSISFCSLFTQSPCSSIPCFTSADNSLIFSDPDFGSCWERASNAFSRYVVDRSSGCWIVSLVTSSITPYRTDTISACLSFTILGPVSLPPRGGPWELLVGMPDANRGRWTRRRLQVCLVPSSGSFWNVNTWFRRDSRVFSGEREGGFWGGF